MPREQWFTPVYAVISVAVTVITTYRTINETEWFTPVYAVISVAVTVITTYRTINETGVASAFIFICSRVLCGIISHLDLWTPVYVLLTARSMDMVMW